MTLLLNGSMRSKERGTDSMCLTVVDLQHKPSAKPFRICHKHATTFKAQAERFQNATKPKTSVPARGGGKGKQAAATNRGRIYIALIGRCRLLEKWHQASNEFTQTIRLDIGT